MPEQQQEILTSLGVTSSRLGPYDLLRDSWRSIRRDLGRSIVTALGTLLGCAAFVATLGLSGTASHQISASFDIRRATEVTVTAREESADALDEAEVTVQWFTAATAAKAGTINGVVHSGRITTLKALGVRRFFDTSAKSIPVDLYATDTEALAAIAPTMTAGRTFDAGHLKRTDHVVMLSSSVAKQLGFDQPGSAIFIGDLGLTVIGIYDDVQRVPGAAAGIIIPVTLEESSSLAVGQTPGRELLLETVSGAATQVAGQAPLAISPAQPELLEVNAPPDPMTLRQEIEGSVTQLSLLVSLVSLVLGTISIGNATAIGVVLRTPEIGLRRALGARKQDIFLQLLGETTALGVLGGLLGTVLGIAIAVTASLLNKWVPVLDPFVPILATIAGLLAGLVAGVWPALRATTITPARALSR